MPDVMIDIETKGKRFDTVVLSIGAVQFDRYPSLPYYLNTASMPWIYLLPSIQEQEMMGRTTDEDTMEWWAKQDPEVREAAFTPYNREMVKSVLEKLSKACEKADEVWAQGPQFDICILENLYESMGIPHPWNKHGIIRDSRTWLKIIGDTRDTGKPAHNALVDAMSQAQAVQNGFIKFREMSILWSLTIEDKTDFNG
jgi:3' exoribonuclease, RNase T-like